MSVEKTRQGPIAVAENRLGILRGACLMARMEIAIAKPVKEQEPAQSE